MKMEYVVRALASKSAGIKCYITFMAKETPNGSLVEYQAKTEWKIRQVHTSLILSFVDLFLHLLILTLR